VASYAFEGPTWHAGPITWSFADTTYSSDQAKAPFSAPLSASAQAVMVQAIQKWAGISGLVFQQVADTPFNFDAADIRIGFGTLGTPTTRIIGQTNYSFKQYLNPDVIVRLEDPSEDPLVSVNNSLVYGGPGGTTLYQVALHEFGHALGMAHSSSPADVMFPSLDPVLKDRRD